MISKWSINEIETLNQEIISANIKVKRYYAKIMELLNKLDNIKDIILACGETFESKTHQEMQKKILEEIEG